jgi:hypothetical protein
MVNGTVVNVPSVRWQASGMSLFRASFYCDPQVLIQHLPISRDETLKAFAWGRGRGGVGMLIGIDLGGRLSPIAAKGGAGPNCGRYRVG